MLIRVVDLETCGFEPPAGICEIGFCDLVRDAEGWHVGLPGNLLVDPGCPIPPETSAVHHITDADVVGAPTFAEAVRSALFEEAWLQAPHVVLVAHNARFERQWLTSEVTGEVHWICTYKSALRIWPEAPAHNNGALRYWLNPAGLERELAQPAHRAGPDAYVTAFLLRELLARTTLDDLVLISAQPALQIRCAFGKHRGMLWSEVPFDYLMWCARQDMDEDVAFTVKTEIRRRTEAA